MRFYSRDPSIITADRKHRIDQGEIDETTKAHNKYLLSALNNYLKVLNRGTEFDLKIFRTISLLFETQNVDLTEELLVCF